MKYEEFNVKLDFRDILQPRIRDAFFLILKVSKKGSILLKSRDPQKAYLGLLPNEHT